MKEHAVRWVSVVNIIIASGFNGESSCRINYSKKITELALLCGFASSMPLISKLQVN